MGHEWVDEARQLLGRLGLEPSDSVTEQENAEYGACICHVGRGSVRFRVGKVTPKKVGMFVAVWTRAVNGSTEPFAAEDDTDLLVITVREGQCGGQFVFPKAALIEHGIVSVAGRGGKRGFRVYPPWSETKNSQAKRSQNWQCDYFLDLDDTGQIDLHKARTLYDTVSPAKIP